MFKALTLTLFFASTLFAEHYISAGKKQTLTKLSSLTPFSKNRSLQTKVDYYKDAAGKRLGIDNTLIVLFQDLSIQLYIEREFSLTLLKGLGSDMFVYQVQDKALTLETSNQLSQLKGIKFAHPDFIAQKKNRTDDPLFSQTWHLEGTRSNNRLSRGINVEEAWEFTKGQNIIVGVYDEGIDIEHEDLRDNILGYANFNNLITTSSYREAGHIDIVDRSLAFPMGNLVRLDNNAHNAPAPAANADVWHGTSCAGLIVAKGDNQRGSVGVAPESKLLAVRYANSNISRDSEAFNEMVRNGVAIISNSWGTYKMDDSFNTTLKELSDNGRNGKGVLIFFAAGNDGCNMDEYYSVNPDMSNKCETSSAYPPIHDESESPYVISIAASTQYNSIAEYSNYGNSIDFTAPGSQHTASIVTTDATGSLGTTNSNYTSTFSGTSAAAPIAAGVAVLVLAQNPELSKEEVLEIFKYSSQKIGSFPYDAKGRNDHWGYGRIDAGAAVKLASKYGEGDIENFAHKIYKDMH